MEISINMGIFPINLVGERAIRQSRNKGIQEMSEQN
jgi:hypothetical protein